MTPDDLLKLLAPQRPDYHTVLHPEHARMIREYYGWTDNPPWLIESPLMPRDLTC